MGEIEFEIPEISVRDLKHLLAQDIVLVDVRENDERTEAAIYPSIHIPLGEVLDDPHAVAQRLASEREEIKSGQPVYIYCRRGFRSLKAAQALKAAGVETVNISGGIQAWLETYENNV